jgi:hypothetical protein
LTQLLITITDRSLDTIVTCLDPHLGHIQANILNKVNYNSMHSYMLIDISIHT